MADELIKNQFSGLDMSSLIGGPLQAICESQGMLAKQTVDFIEQVGFQADPNNKDIMNIRTTKFQYTMPYESTDAQGITSLTTQKMQLDIPLLSVVKIPTFGVDEANITFDMEVKSSTSSESSKDINASLEGSAGVGIGPFKVDVKIKGSIACHEKNTRSTDNSAKYHVDVHAKDFGMPEGLARVLDIISTNMVPQPITDKTA